MVHDFDLDKLSDLIGLVFDSALEPNQWQRLNARIIDMFPGHAGMVLTFDSGKMIGVYDWVGFTRTAIATLDQIEAEEPVGHTQDLARNQRAVYREDKPTPGVVRQSRDLWTDEEFHAGANYQRYLEPAGHGHWTSLNFATCATRYAVILYVEIDADPMEKDTRGLARVLRLLAPHVVRGARMARALYMAKEAAETYKGFLDAIALPLLITDEDGELQMVNSAGQRLLDRGAIFDTRRTRIGLRDDHDDDAFLKCLKDTGADGVARGLRVVDDDGAISLCIAPFHPAMATNVASEQDVFDHQPLYAVFVGSHGDQVVNAGLLQDVFGLSSREATVCTSLLSGQSPAQIAQSAGRSEKTIRNQIQAVHEKVGVTSTRELNQVLSVFRTVGAMFDAGDPHLFGS